MVKFRADTAISPEPALSERVYDRLRAMLLNLDIEPGERLAIDALARGLGVSQTPVREALNRLEAEQLVVRFPNIGFCAAAALNARQVGELFELRALVDPYIARRAATNISQAELEELQQITLRARQFLDGEGRRTYREFIDIDTTFNRLIVAAGGNSVIHELQDRIFNHLHLMRRLFDATVPHEEIDEFDAIARALAVRDGEAAGQAMSRHIANSAQRMHTYLEAQSPERP